MVKGENGGMILAQAQPKIYQYLQAEEAHGGIFNSKYAQDIEEEEDESESEDKNNSVRSSDDSEA